MPLTGTRHARSSRRRRARVLGLVVVAAALGLAGCQIDNTPKGYETTEAGTVVQTNFVATCTGDFPNDASTTTILAPKSFCECAFTVIRNRVPFDDVARDDQKYNGYSRDAPTFLTLDKDLRTDPNAIGKLPKDVQNDINSCKSEAVGPTPGTTASTPGSTASTPGTSPS